MIATLIIITYIANIFLNRWLNKKLWQQDNNYSKYYIFWFIPIMPTFAFTILILLDLETENWFTGKYWK